MTQLNYTKPIEKLSEDFRKLNIVEQNKELKFLLEHYIKHSVEDFELIGKNSSQTENIWNVYTHLSLINQSEIVKLNENQSHKN